MKKVTLFITTLLVMAVSLATHAQTSSDYFPGKWKISAESPMGEVVFNIKLERTRGKLTGEIQRQGEEAKKFKKVEELENRVKLTFDSSSGYEVTFTLKKKDEKNVQGEASTDMGKYGISGTRID